jgi:uncharacterized protein GlcG (DUF336 family)
MYNRHLTAFVVAMMFACLSGTFAVGQDIRQEKNISLTLAIEAARSAVQFAKEKGWTVSVAVVDRAGQLIVLLRADGAGPHTVDASRRKAFTSASARNNTSVILENVQKNPGAANLPMIDGFLVLGGGMPIRIGNEVIGAIGVGGAPGGDLDDQCAEAGINSIRDRLK